MALFSAHLMAATAELGSVAPNFKLKNQKGQEFDLAARKGQWTVLYFYPKSETPGCTKQACAFRDRISKIRKMGAEVYGISINSVEDQKKFHKHHHLNFDLLADAEETVTNLYGAKMPDRAMANRWTFLLDPELKIRAIDKNVDPVQDPERVATKLKELQGK